MGSMSTYLPGWVLASFAALLILGPPAVVLFVDWRKRRRHAAREAREIAQYGAIVAQMPELAECGERILRLVPPIEGK